MLSVACAAALATLNIIEEDGLLENALTVGQAIRDGIAAGLKGSAGIREIRGRGLMIGVELDRPCGDLVNRALAQGLLINVTVDNVVRLLPPLTFTIADGEKLVSILVPLIRQFLAEPQTQVAAKQ
jgi:acetylornithine aminotransferase